MGRKGIKVLDTTLRRFRREASENGRSVAALIRDLRRYSPIT